MKFVAVLLVIAFVAYCPAKGDPDMMQKMVANVSACVDETKVDPALVDKFAKTAEYSDDKNFKCLIKCVYVKSGVMADNGDFNIEQLTKTLDPTDPPALVDKCKGLKGTDVCDTAFIVAKCMDSK